MMDVMKVIAVRQPWAHLIVIGVKPVENRTWTIRYRGPLAILASRQRARQPIELIEERFGITIPRNLPVGGIVGIVDLVDVVTRHPSPFFSGPYGFVLANARPVPLIPMNGQLNIWDAPEHVASLLQAA
jgi:ASCH domain